MAATRRDMAPWQMGEVEITVGIFGFGGLLRPKKNWGSVSMVVCMPKLDMIHVVFLKQCIYFVVEVNLLTLWYKVGVVFIVSLKWLTCEVSFWAALQSGFILGICRYDNTMQHPQSFSRKSRLGNRSQCRAVKCLEGTQRGVTSMKKQTQIQIPEPTFLGVYFSVIYHSAKRKS